MDNLSAQLNKILSDPQSMEQIKNIMGSMGGQIPENHQGQGQQNAAPAPNFQNMAQNLAQTLGGNFGGDAPPGGDIGVDLMGAMARIAPMLSQMKQEDNTTRLLGALRPMLSEARQKKVDEALKILQILRLLPMLRESGILSSIFG